MQPIFVLYLLWVLWFLSWLAVVIAGEPRPRKSTSPLFLIYRLAVLAATLLLFTVTPWPGLDVKYRMWEHALSEQADWALVAAVLAGFVLAWWATLSHLTADSPPDCVVDRGPYKYVRHPVYLGLIVAALATAVMLGRPSSSVGALLYVVLFLIKIVLEERSLRAEEPGYDDYAERVPMLLPLPRWSREPGEQLAAQHAPQSFDKPKEPLPAAPAPPQEIAAAPLTKSVQLTLTLDDQGEVTALTASNTEP